MTAQFILGIIIGVPIGIILGFIGFYLILEYYKNTKDR